MRPFFSHSLRVVIIFSLRWICCITQVFRTTGPGLCPPPANQACSGGSGGFPPGSRKTNQRPSLSHPLFPLRLPSPGRHRDFRSGPAFFGRHTERRAPPRSASSTPAAPLPKWQRSNKRAQGPARLDGSFPPPRFFSSPASSPVPLRKNKTRRIILCPPLRSASARAPARGAPVDVLPQPAKSSCGAGRRGVFPTRSGAGGVCGCGCGAKTSTCAEPAAHHT
jgi:hypothetical protein